MSDYRVRLEADQMQVALALSKGNEMLEPLQLEYNRLDLVELPL